jgi:hypothetical protein
MFGNRLDCFAKNTAFAVSSGLPACVSTIGLPSKAARILDVWLLDI